jgi:hypothetical protein
MFFLQLKVEFLLSIQEKRNIDSAAPLKGKGAARR